MAFTKQVPEWNAVGVEPPQSLKDSGWQAGVKPPADYFNWLQNKAAEAIKELQQKAGEVKTVNGQSPDVNGNVNIAVDTTNLATKQSVEDFQNDYEYQTPTIAGTQIRLQKRSNTNILKFKLDSDLSGTITISLDEGTTSKSLVDVDGTQVTSLEKGFVEVVADASFFILRSRGGLSSANKLELINAINGILNS